MRDDEADLPALETLMIRSIIGDDANCENDVNPNHLVLKSE